MKLNDIYTEEKVRLDPKCWTGKKIGNPKTKMKGGVRVNNCVPAESVGEARVGNRMSDIQIGSPKIVYYKGKAVGEVGIDHEASPGNGQYYMKHYLSGKDMVGFDTKQEALGELKYIVQQMDEGVAEGLPQTLRKVVPGYAKREIDKKMDAGKFGKTDADKDANFQRYKKIQDKLKEQGVAEEYNPEYDDEAGMADNNLGTLRKAVDGIDELIQAGDNLPEWCQEKIAVAENMLVNVWNYMQGEQDTEEDPEIDAMFEAMDRMMHVLAERNSVPVDLVWQQFEQMSDGVLWETAQYQLSQLNEDWQKVNKRDKTDGMSRKAVKAYRRENPGSKLKTAVTTKPSKLKKGSKASKRRKSFCARMSGMKKSRASAKTKRDPNSPINKALRRWNC